MKKAKAVEKAHDDGIWSICWNAARDEIVTASVDETVRVFSRELEEKRKLEGHSLGCVSVATVGRTAVASSIDCTLRFWDMETGEAKGEIEAGPVEAWTVSLSPDEKFVASGTKKGTVNVWSPETLEKSATIEVEGDVFVMDVAFDDRGDKIATGSMDGKVRVFDVATAQCVATYEHHRRPVRTLAWGPNGLALYSGCDDSRVFAYDPRQDGKYTAELTRHTDWVLGVRCSTDGKRLATCSADRTVKLWDLSTNDVCCILNEHTDYVWSCAFSPDGTNLVSGGDDARLVLYDECPPETLDLPDIYKVALGFKPPPPLRPPPEQPPIVVDDNEDDFAFADGDAAKRPRIDAEDTVAGPHDSDAMDLSAT